MLMNIGHVTETLKTLIQAELTVNGATLFGVTAHPPDSTQISGNRTISVYLFHVLESSDLKNLPSRFGSGAVPVRHEPMGLILQYIVTVVAADGAEIGENEIIEQQRLVGFVARAIHDYPVISDRTTIPTLPEPTLVLHPDLRNTDTVLRFNLRPAPMEETVAFWAADDKNAPRLSLFIEARVAVLEPKPAEVAPGIVLSVGQFVFPSAEPQLVTTRNSTYFLPPNPPPGPVEARSVRPSPARVAVFDPGNLTELASRSPSFLDNNQLTLEGVGLGPGRRILLLRNATSTVRVALDQPPSANSGWEFFASDTTVSMRVLHQVVDTEGATRTITPGVYGARVIVLDDRAGLTPRPRSSNEVGFTIVPQIVSAGPSTGGGAGANRYTLSLVTPSLGVRSDVSLSIGGSVLTPTEASSGDPPGPGRYRILFGAVVPPATEPDPVTTLEFQLPNDPNTEPPAPPVPSVQNPLPVRLVIDGATANPEWLIEEAT